MDKKLIFAPMWFLNFDIQCFLVSFIDPSNFRMPLQLILKILILHKALAVRYPIAFVAWIRGINEGNHDVSSAWSGWKSLMEMSDSSWMHHHSSCIHSQFWTLLPQKMSSTAFKICANLVQSNIDGIQRVVMVRFQSGLFLPSVSDSEEMSTQI